MGKSSDSVAQMLMSEVIHTLFHCLCNHSTPLSPFLSQFGDMMESSTRMKRSFYAAKDLYKYRHSYPVKNYVYSLHVSHTELEGRSSLIMKFAVNIAVQSAENIVETKCTVFSSLSLCPSVLVLICDSVAQNYKEPRQPNEYRNLRFYLNKIPLVPDGECVFAFSL